LCGKPENLIFQTDNRLSRPGSCSYIGFVWLKFKIAIDREFYPLFCMDIKFDLSQLGKKVPRRIFGRNREELQNLPCSEHVKVIKSRAMKWVGYVTSLDR
jgi:hypothetical protein